MSEILAPAGSWEALEAAVRAGTDAVYLGSGPFNARQSAQNFDENALREAVTFCHARGVRVQLALNTLIGDGEISKALALAEYACSLGIDAVIVQDLGLASLLRERAPTLALHASTQMSIHTPQGVLAAKELGFQRVVLARELSREETAEILATAGECGMETELFVHGALCMSVSGQCLMSALLGSRSANRGRCAGPCRLPFTVPRSSGYDLSLKDLSLLTALAKGELEGITSLKIEGRMKRPEYVAAAVHAVRLAAAGQEPGEEFLALLRDIFSRTGFTDGYWKSQRGKEMFGRRSEEDAEAARYAIPRLHELYRREFPRVEVELSLSAQPGREAQLTVSDGEHTVCKTAPAEAAKGNATTPEQAIRQLSKTGNTPFCVKRVSCDLAPGLYLPISRLNALRREGLEELLQKRSALRPVDYQNTSLSPPLSHRPADRQLWAKFALPEQLPSLEELRPIAAVCLPAEWDNSLFQDLLPQPTRVVAELPRGIFGRESALQKRLKELYRLGVREVLAQNLGSVGLARRLGFQVHAGHGLNLFNSYALSRAQTMGAADGVVSPELTLQQAEALGGSMPRGLIAYGRLPLMLTRNCPLQNGLACGQCAGKGVRDRKGVTFPVQCRYGCAELLNSRPVWMADRLNELRFADFLLLWFTTEDPGECLRVIKAYQTGGPPPVEFTRGLYYRGVE